MWVSVTVGDDATQQNGERLLWDVFENLPRTSVISFDTDLRVQVARGSLGDLVAREAKESVTGRLLSEILPVAVLAELDGPYRAALPDNNQISTSAARSAVE